LRLHSAGWRKDVFVHATALERSDIRALSEGQKVIYELQTDRRTGETSAVSLKLAA
jgi:CspA family cold shock protein